MNKVLSEMQPAQLQRAVAMLARAVYEISLALDHVAPNHALSKQAKVNLAFLRELDSLEDKREFRYGAGGS